MQPFKKSCPWWQLFLTLQVHPRASLKNSKAIPFFYLYSKLSKLTHLGVGWGSNKNFRGHLDQLPHSESNFYKGFWIQCFHNGKDFKSKNVVQKREATERVPASMAPQKNEDFTYEERPPQRFRKYSRPKKNYGPCGITGHDYSNSNCLMWHISGIPAAN